MAILQKVKFTQEKVKNFGRKSYVHFLENKLFFPGKMEQIFTLKDVETVKYSKREILYIRKTLT